MYTTLEFIIDLNELYTFYGILYTHCMLAIAKPIMIIHF